MSNNIATTIAALSALGVVVMASISPASLTQEVYARHTDNPLPNPSEEGEEHGDTGLFDHGCSEGGPDPNGPGSNGYQQGRTNSGECDREGLPE